jgi:hypothetical protein
VQLAVAVLISGHVVTTEAHWTADGARIITDVVVATSDGQQVTVSQLGGELDGFGQITFPGPDVVAAGSDVSIEMHDAATLAGAHRFVVDDVHYDPVSGDAPFVREGPSPHGHYLFWRSGCVFVNYDSAGTTEVAGDDEFGVLDGSIATWDTAIPACGYMRLKPAGKVTGYEVGKDYLNLIKFRDTKWCIPATATDLEVCHNPAAAGITTLTFIKDGSDRDGEIVDTDVEINGVNFAISVGGVTLGQGGCQADLANTVTHELGHVLGLEHTCRGDKDPARVDGTGKPVPFCTDTNDPTIVDATMYPFQECGETKKASLSNDDVQGVCSIYPKALDPGTCEVAYVPGGCCSAGGDAAPDAAAGLLVLGMLRRRRPTSAR